MGCRVLNIFCLTSLPVLVAGRFGIAQNAMESELMRTISRQVDRIFCSMNSVVEIAPLEFAQFHLKTATSTQRENPFIVESKFVEMSSEQTRWLASLHRYNRQIPN
jgi:hypothetical protein